MPGRWKSRKDWSWEQMTVWPNLSRCANRFDLVAGQDGQWTRMALGE